MIQLRQATLEDVATITTHRIRMFIDMGEDPVQMESIRSDYGVWLRRNIANGDSRCRRMALSIAGGGLWLVH